MANKTKNKTKDAIEKVSNEKDGAPQGENAAKDPP